MLFIMVDFAKKKKKKKRNWIKNKSKVKNNVKLYDDYLAQISAKSVCLLFNWKINYLITVNWWNTASLERVFKVADHLKRELHV